LDQFIILLLGYFTLMLVVYFIIDLQSRVSRPLLLGVFGSLIGVLVGFSLTLGWDLWKRSDDRHAELLRAKRSVEQEINTNLILIATDLSLFAPHPNPDTSPSSMTPLFTSAGETAYLKGSFEPYSVDLSVELGNVYSSIYILNKRIEIWTLLTLEPFQGFIGDRVQRTKADIAMLLQTQQKDLHDLRSKLVKLK
jgi:hypothetical protein